MATTRKDPAEAGSLRFYYRNWRPTLYGRFWTRIWAWVTSLGLMPDIFVTLPTTQCLRSIPYKGRRPSPVMGCRREDVRGAAGVPQKAADFAAPPKSAALGQGLPLADT
jgi:hypothetical protein